MDGHLVSPSAPSLLAVKQLLAILVKLELGDLDVGRVDGHRHLRRNTALAMMHLAAISPADTTADTPTQNGSRACATCSTDTLRPETALRCGATQPLDTRNSGLTCLDTTSDPQ